MTKADRLGAFSVRRRMPAMQWLRHAWHEFANSEVGLAQVQSECAWIDARRPYYSVHPSIAPALVRVTLDVPCNLIRLPLL